MSIYGWFSNSDDYAGIRGASRRDREATRFDQRVPTPGEVVLLEAVRDSDEPIGDFPNTGIAYPKCISGRALAAIRPLLEPFGLLRQSELEGLEYWLYWPRNVVDCLDYDASEIIKMPSGYEQLITPAFRSNVDEAGPVFLVPEFSQQVLFVSDAFLKTAQDADLKGLELRSGADTNAEIVRIG